MRQGLDRRALDRQQKGHVSVYLAPNEYKRGLTAWQWGVAGLTASVMLICTLDSPLFAFSPYALKPMILWFVAGMGFAVVKFPTGRQPFRYISFLKVAPPLKPSAEVVSVLSNNMLHVRIFGEDKIATGCTPLVSYLSVDDLSVKSVGKFISVFEEKCTFVCTTGLPDSSAHPNELGLPHCIIMCDAGSEPTQAASRLTKALERAGLQPRALDPTIFSATAGHGMTSSHFIVEQLPYSLALGWLGQMANSSCDFTITVSVRGADLNRVRKEAAKALNPQLSSHAPSLQELDEYVEALAIKNAAVSLLEGKIKPYELSVDVNICSDNHWNRFCAKAYFQLLCIRHRVQHKHVRERSLPFSAVFNEQPVPYDMTVTEAAAVACCPFLFDMRQRQTEPFRRSNRLKLLDLLRFSNES